MYYVAIYLQVVAQGVIKYCIQNMLGKNQFVLLFEKALEFILAESHKVNEILDLKEHLTPHWHCKSITFHL